MHNIEEDEEETTDEGTPTACDNAPIQQAALLTGLIEQVDFSACFMDDNPTLMDQHLSNAGTPTDSR